MSKTNESQDLDLLYLEKELRDLIKKANDERYNLCEVKKRISEIMAIYETRLNKFEDTEKLKGALTEEERTKYAIEYFGIVERIAKGSDTNSSALLDLDELMSAGSLGLTKGLLSYRKKNDSTDTLEGWLVTCVKNEVTDTIRRMRKAIKDLSLDYEYSENDGDGGSIKTNLLEDEKVDLQAVAENNELKEIIVECVESCLNDREKFIAYAYFELGDVIPKMTQQEIALALKLTQPAITRLIKVTQEKLKNHLVKFYWQTLQDYGFF